MLIPIVGAVGIAMIFLLVVWSGNFQPLLENEQGKFAGMVTKDLGTYDVIRPTTNCDNSYFPVCGNDGETYDNTCKARAAGTTVAYRGVCQG